MTVKEAADKLNLDEKEVRKRRKDNMIIGLRKVNGRLIIPDDTAIIPSKKEIQAFLVQILKFKNDSNYVISRELCPDANSLNNIVTYLFKRGFIGEVKSDSNIAHLFSRIKVTESGFDYVVKSNINSTTTSNVSINILSVNPQLKVGAVVA